MGALTALGPSQAAPTAPLAVTFTGATFLVGLWQTRGYSKILHVKEANTLSRA
jgi:hypothetical protein